MKVSDLRTRQSVHSRGMYNDEVSCQVIRAKVSNEMSNERNTGPRDGETGDESCTGDAETK